jgi:hypothetical protein
VIIKLYFLKDNKKIASGKVREFCPHEPLSYLKRENKAVFAKRAY